MLHEMPLRGNTEFNRIVPSTAGGPGHGLAGRLQSCRASGTATAAPTTATATQGLESQNPKAPCPGKPIAKFPRIMSRRATIREPSSHNPGALPGLQRRNPPLSALSSTR